MKRPEIIDRTKDFYKRNEVEIKEWGKVIIFALISYLWIILTTGSSAISLVFLLTGASMIASKRFLNSKKELIKSLSFWGHLMLAFIIASIFGSLAESLLCIVIFAITYASFQIVENKKEWIASAIIPFLIVMFVEYLQGNAGRMFLVYFRLHSFSRLGLVISLWLIAFVACFFIHLFNSKKIGYCITLGIFSILGIINFFVLQITAQPLILSDVKLAQTAMGVVKEQRLTREAIERLGLALILLSIFFFGIIMIFKSKYNGKRIKKRILVIAGLILLCPGLLFASTALHDTQLLYAGHLKYGFIGNFFIRMNDGFKLPRDAHKYVIDDVSDEGEYKPNIIVIMNEAFSDLGSTFDMKMSEDPLEYFHELQKQYPNGISYSSVKGNNTVSSEWEFLSSSPTALTTKGAIIYQDNCVPMRSIVSMLNSRGYKTVGLHPYFAYGYNRERIYSSFGFDDVYFLEDLPGNLETVRGFVTDSENYKELIRLYEENEANGDEPFFCFNITMQNHGGYLANPYEDVVAIGKEDNIELSTYLSMINKSDDALKELIQYFEQVEEDTIILMYGDHQPLLRTEFYEKLYGKTYAAFTFDELKNVYNVPYLIWSNYELNEEASPKETSICYLANVLFETGNIPKSTWLNMVAEYQKSYPIVTENFIERSDGNVYEVNTIMNAIAKNKKDPLNLYQKYSYGILYGLENWKARD